MSGILCLLLALQDPLEQQIEDSLRQFEASDEMDQALSLLSSQLIALGAQATNPIARRLADDLRDGMASAAAPALIDALAGRPDALAPLQAAFRDAATSAAGRIELAEALLQLNDAISWRAGLLGIAGDRREMLSDRLRSLKVLLEAEDPGAAELLRSIALTLGELEELQQREVVDFLIALGTPLARELLRSIAADGRLSAAVRASARPRPSARATPGEPGATMVERVGHRSGVPASRIVEKKGETGMATFFTLPTILAGSVTLILLVLLLVEALRKG